MAYEFSDFRIHLTDKRPGAGNDDRRWADVEFTLFHTERDTYHLVQVPVCIPHDESQSIASTKQQALDHAKTILQAALSVVQENDLGALHRMKHEADARQVVRDTAHHAELASQAASELDSVLRNLNEPHGSA